MGTKDNHASGRVWTTCSDDGCYPQGISGCSVFFPMATGDI